jgi:hypothetical protein
MILSGGSGERPGRMVAMARSCLRGGAAGGGVPARATMPAIIGQVAPYQSPVVAGSSGTRRWAVTEPPKRTEVASACAAPATSAGRPGWRPPSPPRPHRWRSCRTDAPDRLVGDDPVTGTAWPRSRRRQRAAQLGLTISMARPSALVDHSPTQSMGRMPASMERCGRPAGARPTRAGRGAARVAHDGPRRGARPWPPRPRPCRLAKLGMDVLSSDSHARASQRLLTGQGHEGGQMMR